ncbi:MAG: carbon-nitrogen hydrolase family protein [Tepidimonas sp.]|uniref:carbon-nitrogen hydrolase family protein n=1 Tax=Tepidimonas sp. TaxID=2002775 RepID=UPI00259DCAA4|nr:carbon-nitrogen hydrolase family protein [Tepidimonas sp.]MDM7456621.1 carbon-nitrogen hydrolase family protein [Tepidimonas sp.]
MKVAAIQMVSGTSLDLNLAQAQQLLDQARHAGAELAVLPEYFCLMGRRDADKLLMAEAFGSGTVQDFLSQTARQLGLWIVGGTVPLATDDPKHAANASLVYDPQGRCVARYDKIHLFRFHDGQQGYDEAAVLKPGEQPVSFALTDHCGTTWRVGLSVCYDLRFPELYRQLAADVLVVPAAFTHVTGQAHWEVLLRARAIENQAYVIASAQGGVHDNGRQTWGQSMVIDPWGVVLAQQASGAGVVVAELDHARLEEVRRRLPALQHRRL